MISEGSRRISILYIDTNFQESKLIFEESRQKNNFRISIFEFDGDM